jgi:CRP-like cAMP-binding protein
MLTGLILREVQVAGRWCTEPLGPGDVLRPWDSFDPELVPSTCSWTVLGPARLATLDGRFAAAAGRWPGLVEEVLHRALQRARWMSALHAVASIPHLNERLNVLLRLLADRWGRIGPDGLVLCLPLTHETLARIAGAQRPSVTSALGRMTDAGQLERRDDGSWVLPGYVMASPRPEPDVDDLRRASAIAG